MEQVLTISLSVIVIVGGAIFMLLQRHRSKQETYLAAWLILIHVALLLMFSITYYADWENPFFNLLALLFYGLLIAIPPSMHVYQKVLFSPQRKNILQHSALHYLPAGLLLLINVFGFFVITYAKPGSVFHTYTEEMIFSLNFLVITFFFFIQNLYYIITGTINWKKNTTPSTSETKHAGLYLLLYTLFMAAVYIQQIATSGYTGWELSAIILLFTIGLLLLSYSWYTINPYSKQQYQKSTLSSSADALLSDKQVDQILTRLQLEMEKNKVYTHSDLSIAQLAKRVDTNVKYLRYVINKFHTGSFVAYVNQYRIEEAKHLLRDQSQDVYTIESIGNTAGFKSKSSFYAAFKDQVGMTPSQFRQKHSTFTKM